MPLRAVFDASLLLRAALDEHEAAREWTDRAERGEIEAFAPGVVWAEVLHVLVRYVRAGHLSLAEANERLVSLLELRVRIEHVEALAPAALARAVSSTLSGYDALYVVLADASDAILVTADRRLADEASKAELIA
jgi:predicted nucleic acid-binding protein